MDNPKLTELFDSIADEIRNKRGTTAEIKAANFPEEIALIDTDPSAGTTASASDLLEGKTAYSNKTKLVGTMPNNGKVTEVLTSQSEKYTIPKGYHDGTGTITAQLGAASITSNVSASISDIFSNSDGGFDITATATSLEPTIDTAGYISASIGEKKGDTSTSTKTLSKIEIGSTVATSGTTTYQPVINTSTKSSSETFTNAYSGTIVRGTTPSGTDPYVKVSSASKTGNITITPTSKVINAGYGTTTQYTNTDTAKNITVGAGASQDTYIPIKKGSLSVTDNQISVTDGWLSGSDSTSISGASITSGSGNPSVTAPTYNSTSKVFRQTVSTGTITAPIINSAGYISDSIGVSNSSSAKTITNDLPIITIDNTIPTLTRKPTISKISKSSSETWIDASSGSITTTPSASIPYVKVQSNANTESVTITPTVTSKGYSDGTYFNKGKSSYSATTGATASDAYYVPINIGSATINNDDNIDVSRMDITYSSGNINVSASGSRDYDISLTSGYITSANGTSITAEGSASKAVTSLDNNLVAGNIRSGATIFDTEGTYICPTDTSNPATSGDILSGKTAYQGNKQVTGSMANNGDTSDTITTQGGTVTIPKGYTSGGTVTANINSAVLTGNNSEATISDPTINSAGTKFIMTATGTVLPPTVSTAGYIDTNPSVSSASITGSKELNVIAGTATASDVTFTPTISVSTEDDSSYTWINAASSATATESPSSGNVYTKITIPSASKDVSVTKSITTAGYGTSANNNITVNSGKASLTAKTYYAQVKRGSAKINDTTINDIKPSIWYNTNTKTIDSSFNITRTVTATATEGYILSTDLTNKVIGLIGTNSADPSEIGLPDANVTISGNKVSYDTGWTASGTQTVSSGTATSGVGTITTVSDPTLTSGKFRITASGTVAAPTITAGWITSGSGNTVTTKNIDLDVIKLSASASGTSSITPTFAKGSKGSSESWVDAMDTTSSKTIVNSIPTTATPYVKVSMTGGSSTITATPSVNTKGYGSTASGGYSVASSGTKTVSVDNKTLYIPIKESTAANSTISAQGDTYKIPVGYVSSEKTITASLPNASLSGGGLTLTTAGSTSSTITTAPTYNSTSGKYEYSISATRAKVTNGTSGYLSSGDKIGATTSSSKIQVPTGSATTPTTTITKNPTISLSNGQIRAAYSASTDVTPSVSTGWVASGTKGAITTTGDTTTTLSETDKTTLVGTASITSGTGTISIGTPSYDSTNANFIVNASATISAPTVSTPGYVTSSIGTKNTNTASGSTTLSRISLGATISNGGATTPVINRTAKPSSDTWVDAASGSAITNKPSSGPYVQVDVPSSTKTIYGYPNVKTSGYGTTSYFGTTSVGSTTGGHNAATTKYIPITLANPQPTRSGATTSWGTGWVTSGSTTVPTATVSANKITTQNGTATISAGYLASSQTITASLPTSKASVSATSFTITPTISYSNGSIIATGSNSKAITPVVSNNGYITTTNTSSGNITASLSGGGVTPTSLLGTASISGGVATVIVNDSIIYSETTTTKLSPTEISSGSYGYRLKINRSNINVTSGYTGDSGINKDEETIILTLTIGRYLGWEVTKDSSGNLTFTYVG